MGHGLGRLVPQHRGEVLGCQRGGLGEVDLPVLAHREHPVDHAAVEMDSNGRASVR